MKLYGPLSQHGSIASFKSHGIFWDSDDDDPDIYPENRLTRSGLPHAADSNNSPDAAERGIPAMDGADDSVDDGAANQLGGIASSLAKSLFCCFTGV
jgi:hypothetical protein